MSILMSTSAAERAITPLCALSHARPHALAFESKRCIIPRGRAQFFRVQVHAFDGPLSSLSAKLAVTFLPRGSRAAARSEGLDLRRTLTALYLSSPRRKSGSLISDAIPRERGSRFRCRFPDPDWESGEFFFLHRNFSVQRNRKTFLMLAIASLE